MNPLEREMEAVGLAKRPLVAGVRPELPRRAVPGTHVARERDRARLVEKAKRDAAVFSSAIPSVATKAIAWGTVGAVLVVSLMVASVPWQRSQYTQEQLKAESESKADLVCVAGKSTARDDSSWWTELTGGSVFLCTAWETNRGRGERAFAQREELRKTREAAEREMRGY